MELSIQPNLQFSNPQEVDDEEFSSIIGIDFSPKKETTEPTKPAKEESTKVDEETETDETPNLTIVPKEGEGVEEKLDYVSVINLLADENVFGDELEAFEGFDPDADATKETLVKLIQHNANKKADETLVEFYESLSEQTKRIVSFDLNTKEKDKDVDSYLRALIEENSIKALNVENEYDQEKILKQWYRNKEGYTPQEIEEKIVELKENSLLEKEAKRIKPKLDVEAENFAKKQEDEQKALRDLEKQVSENYSSRVIETLEGGVVGGIKLNKEELATVYSFLTDDKMEVTVHGNKKALMSPLEAVIFYNKYDKNGNLENLALATLLLTNPKKFEEAYSKKAETKNTEEFVRNHKYSNSLKIGGEGIKQSSKETKETKEAKEKRYSWNLKI